jgi:hypothetical protein
MDFRAVFQALDGKHEIVMIGADERLLHSEKKASEPKLSERNLIDGKRKNLRNFHLSKIFTTQACENSRPK